MPDRGSKPVIFTAFANDRVDGVRYLRNLPEEARRLRDQLEKAERDRLCELVMRQNSTPQEILDVLFDPRFQRRIAIFHFGGHANGYQLLLETAAGGGASAHGSGLSALLGQQAQQGELALVFLNGCSTQGHVQGLLEAGVPVVIATSQAIDDVVATEVATRFYQALAAGQSIRRAFLQAEGAVKLAAGGEARHFYAEAGDSVDTSRVPWDWSVRPGSEAMVDWDLATAAGNLLFGLPPLPRRDLPESPYRYLDWYREEDAELFFGRDRAIRDLYARVTAADSPPLVLFYGQSGVGKSSLLAAGLLPRLRDSHDVAYVRRELTKGLLGTLASPRSPLCADEKGLGWLRVEEEAGKPLLVILDQVEEAYTRPNEGMPDEWEVLLAALQGVFGDPARRPRGKLLLGFRKEWLAEIEGRVAAAQLPRAKVFLERLDRAGVLDVVTGPVRMERLRQQYGLSIDDDTTRLVADDVIADRSSPVAPTLQTLLTRLWEAAKERDYDSPTFDEELYLDLKREGIGLDYFLEQQLAKLAEWREEVVESGLALDLLAYHTTSRGTAGEHELAETKQVYRHVGDLLPELLQRCKDLYLLADPAANRPGTAPASRLAHDALALLVRARFDGSDAPGQRARRILESRAVDWREGKEGTVLDDGDLEQVRKGAHGMRAWTVDEIRLFEASSHASKVRADERAAALRSEQEARDAQVAAEAKAATAEALKDYVDAHRLALEADAAGVKGLPQRRLLLALEAATLGSDGAAPYPVAETALRSALGAMGGAPLVGHGGAVRSVAFSPDGRWLASGCGDGMVWLRDVEQPSMSPVILSGHASSIRALAFTPDGRWLASGSADNTVRLWRTDDKEADPLILAGHGRGINAMSISPDGRWLATGSGDAMVRLWELAAPGSDAVVLAGHERPTTALAFSPESRWLASSSADGSVRLWDIVEPGVEPEVVSGPDATVRALAFSPDGRWLARGCDDGTVRLWDTEGPKAAQAVRTQSLVTRWLPGSRRVAESTDGSAVLVGHRGYVQALAFSPDGRLLASASSDTTVLLWAMEDNSAVPVVLSGHSDSVRAVTFSRDGRWLASGSSDGTVRLWRTESPSDSPEVLAGHEAWIDAIAFSPSGRWLASGSGDRMVRLWDMEMPAGEPAVLASNVGMLGGLAFSPNGKWLASHGLSKDVQLWDMEQPAGEPLLLAGPLGGIRSVVFSLDGRWLAAGGGGAVFGGALHLWDMSDPAGEPVVLAGPDHGIEELAFSPNGRWLASYADSYVDTAVRLRELARPASWSVVLTGNKGRIRTMSFSPDGRWLVTGGDDAMVRLWDMEQLTREPSALPGHEHGVAALAFSPDSRILVTGGFDSIVRLWDTTNPSTAPVLLSGHNHGIRALAFSPDGNRLATGSGDSTVRLWDMVELTADPAVLPARIDRLAFSPDGRRLATCTSIMPGKGVQLWDIEKPGVDPVLLTSHEREIWGLAFSPNGRWLATGGGDKTVRLWNVSVDHVVDLACRTVGRNLTREEWQRYLPGRQYRPTCPQWPAAPPDQPDPVDPVDPPESVMLEAYSRAGQAFDDQAL